MTTPLITNILAIACLPLVGCKAEFTSKPAEQIHHHDLSSNEGARQIHRDSVRIDVRELLLTNNPHAQIVDIYVCRFCLKVTATSSEWKNPDMKEQ